MGVESGLGEESRAAGPVPRGRYLVLGGAYRASSGKGRHVA